MCAPSAKLPSQLNQNLEIILRHTPISHLSVMFAQVSIDLNNPTKITVCHILRTHQYVQNATKCSH